MTQAERPKIVEYFELGSVALLAIELLVGSGLAWDDVIWVPLMLWLILSITRRKSSLARWILSAVFGLGASLLILLFVRGVVPLAVLTWPAWLLLLASIAQFAILWSPVMSRWLASNSPVARAAA